MRVLLTGASGFIAAHILKCLLDHGHAVVATVRSQDKADRIAQQYTQLGEGRLVFALVKDIAQPNAFKNALENNTPIDAVVHTASPFHFDIKSPADFLDPAIKGTVSILKDVHAYAPSVRRVVLTSSFAAIIDLKKEGTGHIYSEEDWNPVTMDEVLEQPEHAYLAYRASKTFAEKAAWDFVKQERPSFDLVSMNPPFVFGPTVFPLLQTEELNTSNFFTRDFLQGKYRDRIPETGDFIWVDVRDLALGHVRALEKQDAGGKRFFITAGHYNNRQIAAAIRKHFPEFDDKVPDSNVPGGGFPEQGLVGYNNNQTKDILGIDFRLIETCITDSVQSFKHKI